MILKNISAKISSETEEQAYQHVRDLKALFPFLIDLPTADRIRMTKLSRRYVDFVERCLFHAKANPQYVPPFVANEDFANDVDLKNALHRIYAEVNDLGRKIKDTILVVEEEAYAAARIFYKSVKAAAQEGAQGAQLINQDLAYNYKKMGASKPEDVNNKQEQEKSA